MQQRPKLQLAFSTADKLVALAGWILLVVVWGLTWLQYSKLRDTIPKHFNGLGVADGHGPKERLFSLPIMATLLFAGLSVLNRFPHLFNYPTQITQDNARSKYTSATRLIRFLKLSIVFIFGLMEWRTIQCAHGYAKGIGNWFLPLALALLLIPVGYHLYVSLNKKKSA